MATLVCCRAAFLIVETEVVDEVEELRRYFPVNVDWHVWRMFRTVFG
ncbi:hypothetical protein [Sutcliffiella horikoshii]|nr:hypothetical protein [Sutcliffiella horikoshii]